MATSHTGYTTNLPLEDVTGGPAWVAWEVDGGPLPTQARRPGPPARAAPVLLEEREVGRAARPCSTTTSRASGSATATTTMVTPGWSSGTRGTDQCPTRLSRFDGSRPRSSPSRPRPRGRRPSASGSRSPCPPCGSALRAPPHRTRRLHGPAVVFGRVPARRLRDDRSHDRDARGGRGVGLPELRGAGRRRARAARADRRLVRLGRRLVPRCSSAVVRASCR